MKSKTDRCLLLISLSMILFFACNISGEDDSPTLEVPPPQLIVGTFGLVDENGTFELHFDQTPQSSSASFRAMHGITGSLTFSTGESYPLSGTYESLNGFVDAATGTVSHLGSDMVFRIYALYVVMEGTGAEVFDGSIRRIHSSPLENAAGSVAGCVSSTQFPAKNYLGAFSGETSGTWNMTIRNGSLVGSYSNSNPGYGSGGFTGTVNGSTMTLKTGSNTSGQVVAFTGGGTLTGDSCNGTWSITIRDDNSEENTYSGTWIGAAAD